VVTVPIPLTSQHAKAAAVKSATPTSTAYRRLRRTTAPAPLS
jgi:hypothetical protein